jgi:CheY-like chemotaxis protein
MSDVRVTGGGNEIEMSRHNGSSVDASTSDDDATAASHRVLMAEEDVEARTRLEEILRDAGYEVVSCSNGWDLIHHLGYYLAPERYRREEFGLILADVQLSGATGFDVLVGLRREGIPPMALIVETVGEEIARRARRSGAAAVFERSVARGELLEIVCGIVPANA